MIRRDLLLAALVALVTVATVPAYDRVFAEPDWRPSVLAVTAGAIILSLLARWVRLPAFLAVPVSGLALLGALPWLLGVGDGWRAGFSAQWAAILDTLNLGLTAVVEETAPVVPEPGLLALLVVGWWVVTAVSTELVVRTRTIGPALVLLVALWTVPLAIPSPGTADSVEVIAWLAAAGMLGLAHVHVGVPGAVSLPASGLILLAGAVAAGVAAPGLLPGWQADPWLSVDGGSSPRGYQPIVDVSTRLRSPVERDVLRVRASQPTYLRLAGLDSFDGSTWRLGPPGSDVFRPDAARLFPADRPLPPEEPAQRFRRVEVDVEVLDLENIYVPLPYQPVEVLGPIRSEMVWSTEGGFLAAYDPGDLLRDPRVGLTAGSTYRVLADQPDPMIDDLRDTTIDPEVLAAATTLPRSYPELGALAREVYEEAGASSTIQRVLALQDWFVGPGGGFTYDLEVPALRGEDALTRFVLEDRVGYCEYFATAMAVMLRETGIPARVAVGFLPGERIAEADPELGERLDTYLVTTGDAHAWVEVLFPGAGWITFEPTPRADGAQIVPRADELAPQTSAAELEASADPAAPDIIEVPPDADAAPPSVPQPEDAPEATDEAGAGALRPLLTTGRLAASLLIVGALLAVLLWSPLRRRWRRGTLVTDPRAAVLAAQRDLLRTAGRLGHRREPHETTREVLSRWERDGQVPAGSSAVARSVQAAAFGGALTAAEASATVTTLDRAREHLVQASRSGDVVRARLSELTRRVTRDRERARSAWRSR